MCQHGIDLAGVGGEIGLRDGAVAIGAGDVGKQLFEIGDVAIDRGAEFRLAIILALDLVERLLALERVETAGEDIPFLGRLLAVADAFSAMTTDRPYRKGMDWDVALEQIESNKGSQFDPELATVFVRAVAKRRVIEKSATAA